ncbi:right-handed parallel beta-helix repeat-containing protein [Bacillus rhizoplanae]|uniref:right-handed parallel beta-helix repeat-containing protein n=1 Tax=Bacillus rhizoplanae TaxID=2880966 RepID=UPI003D1B4B7D
MYLEDCYIIELDRWGIKNDGTLPIETTQGINNAFMWAGNNDFRTVILPKGNYLVDKNSALTLQSNTHYKFHDCLFVKEANNLTGYTVIVCDSIKNVIIEGATIKGDREKHDYSSGGTHEWGHGIAIKNSCYNILIKDCDVSECTGDGYVTSMDFSTIGGVQHPAHFAKGDIDSQGNLDTTKTNYTTVTRFFDVTGDLVRSVGYFYYSGDGYGGYGNGCNLNKTVIKVHFYAENGSYLGFINTRSYEFVYLDSIPVGTTKVRFSFLQNYDLMNGNLHYVMCTKIPQYVYFVNCKSYKNRRLGASVTGGRFITFDSCEIFNNSNPMNNSIGCNPGYGIDIEDGYMVNQKITIRDSNIYDNRAGAFICVSTRGVYLENNKLKGNVNLSGSGDDYLSVNNMYYGAISGRSITSGVEIDGTFCTFRNDSIFGQACSLNGGNTTLDNCVFSKSTVSLGGETVKVSNCKFTFDDPDKDGIFGFSNKNLEIRDSLFDIRRAKGLASASYAQTENAIFSHVKFLTNECSGGHYVGAKNLIVENCEFIHSGKIANYSRMMASESMRVENTIIKNQSFRFDGGDIYGIEKLAKDTGYTTHSFRNNQIIWDVSYGLATHEARGSGVSFIYIPRLEIAGNNLEVNGKINSLGSQHTLRVFTENYLNLSNNTIVTTNDTGISTTGTITIEGAYRKSGSTLAIPKTLIVAQNNNKINSDIIFTTNVNSQLEKNVLGNILLASLVSSEPTFGKYSRGELLYNSVPTAGGYVGWVCIAAGTANNSAWVANKGYSINSLMNSNGKVYKCIVAGTSGIIAPSHTSGIATDGSVTWQYVDTLAVFKTFGLISS